MHTIIGRPPSTADLTILQTIKISANSGSGKQIVPGALYAIATPDDIDSICSTVSINRYTGEVSWANSATSVNITNWIFNGANNLPFDRSMTITVLGRSETADPLVLVDCGSVTPVLQKNNIYSYTLSKITATSELLVFVQSDQYVGLGDMTSHSVTFFCENDSIIKYKIFATNGTNVNPLKDFSGYFIKGSFWKYGLQELNQNDHGETVAVNLKDFYICINNTKGAVTESTVGSPGVIGTGVRQRENIIEISMFSMVSSISSLGPFRFENGAFNNRYYLIGEK